MTWNNTFRLLLISILSFTSKPMIHFEFSIVTHFLLHVNIWFSRTIYWRNYLFHNVSIWCWFPISLKCFLFCYIDLCVYFMFVPCNFCCHCLTLYFDASYYVPVCSCVPRIALSLFGIGFNFELFSIYWKMLLNQQDYLWNISNFLLYGAFQCMNIEYFCICLLYYSISFVNTLQIFIIDISHTVD